MTAATLKRRLAELEQSMSGENERRSAIIDAAIQQWLEQSRSLPPPDPDPEYEAALRVWLASEESKSAHLVDRWVAEILLKAEEDMRSTSPKVVDHER